MLASVEAAIPAYQERLHRCFLSQMCKRSCRELEPGSKEAEMCRKTPSQRDTAFEDPATCTRCSQTPACLLPLPPSPRGVEADAERTRLPGEKGPGVIRSLFTSCPQTGYPTLRTPWTGSCPTSSCSALGKQALTRGGQRLVLLVGLGIIISFPEMNIPLSCTAETTRIIGCSPRHTCLAATPIAWNGTEYTCLVGLDSEAAILASS